MNHRDIQNAMPDYLEGDLSLERRALFDAHLDTCRECAREISEMRATIGLLRRLPTPEPPPDLAANVMRRIAQGEGQPGWLDRAAGWLADLNARVSEPRFAVPFTVLAASLAVVLVTSEGGFTAASARSEASIARRPQVAQPSELAQRRSQGQVRAQRVAKNSVALPGAGLGMRGSDLGNDRFPRRGGARLPATGGHKLELASAAIGGHASRQLLRSRDEWLDVVIANPRRFAREHGELSSIEQELWVTHLSRGAVERGLLDEIVDSLRATTDPVALALANSFETAGLGR